MRPIRPIWMLCTAASVVVVGSNAGCTDDLDDDGYSAAEGDCNDLDASINPEAPEVCNGVDDNCDGNVDDTDADGDGAIDQACGGTDCNDSDPSTTTCTVAFGGHRIQSGNDLYYTVNNGLGFGILGKMDWYGGSDPGSYGMTTTLDEAGETLYYSDTVGHVYRQERPYGSRSEAVGVFADLELTGGGVLSRDRYYVVDVQSGDIHAMDVKTGDTKVYARQGGLDCPVSAAVSSIAIAGDGRVFRASSCGIVVYTPGQDARVLTNAISVTSGLALDSKERLYVKEATSNIVFEVDKEKGTLLSKVAMGLYGGGQANTMAFDLQDNFVFNDVSSVLVYNRDGALLMEYFLPEFNYLGYMAIPSF